MISTEESIDRFQTVYLSTHFMNLLIVIDGGSVNLDDWINFLPSNLQADAVWALRKTYGEIRGSAVNDREFKQDMIHRIQKYMIKANEEDQNRKPWFWDFLNKNRPHV